MAINFQGSPARILINVVAANSQMKRRLLSAAEIQSFQQESLDEALRLTTCGKPCCPNLNGHSMRISDAAVAPGVHQQITEPPRTATIRQSHTKKPNFITAPDGQLGEHFV